MYVNAGSLDQRITLQERADDARDSRGQASAAWVDVLTDIAASADTRVGSDFFSAGQEHATHPVTFRIRYRSTVHERMRVIWKGKVCELVGRPIDVKGAGVALDLPCVVGTGEGR